MLVVHGTKKFLERVGGPTAAPDGYPTTWLGSWYASVLFWRPQVALFVNEETLLPLLLPLAPAKSVTDRLVPGIAALLGAHGVARRFVDAQLREMGGVRLAKTSNRSVLGVMNEFAYLAGVYRQDAESVDLLPLSLKLAEPPSSPLYKRHITPHDELLAQVAEGK